jgi:hypothetical protein
LEYHSLYVPVRDDSCTPLNDVDAARWDWTGRLNYLVTSLKGRSEVTAVRRAIFAMAGMTEAGAENWLTFAKMARKLGRYQVAASALRQAHGTGVSLDDVTWVFR